MPTRDITDDAANTDKAVPTVSDKVPIIDVSTTPDSLKESTLQQIWNVLTGLTAKTTLTGADEFSIADSAASYAAKKITWTNTLAAIYSGAGQWGMINGKLSVTVASNNLTVAVKTLAGSDPSASDPVLVRIGDTVRSITAALSVTKNAGTNWCNSGSDELKTQEVDYFAYLGYNATDGVVIGFSRIPYANLYSDFSATTTNEKYAAISTITNAAAGDNYVNIGRFAATLSAGAGYTWTVPTFTAINLVQRPAFESRVLSWNPVFTGFSSDPTNNFSRYFATMNTVRFMHRSGTNGTSNATTFTFTLPFTCAATGTWQAMVNFIDNTANSATPGRCLLTASSNSVGVFTNVASGVWTASGGKRIGGMQWADYEYQ